MIYKILQCICFVVVLSNIGCSSINYKCRHVEVKRVLTNSLQDYIVFVAAVNENDEIFLLSKRENVELNSKISIDSSYCLFLTPAVKFYALRVPSSFASRYSDTSSNYTDIVVEHLVKGENRYTIFWRNDTVRVTAYMIHDVSK